MGDVVNKGEPFGDGVNIAARLEALPKKWYSISKSVYDLLFLKPR